jgi:hypothetical protein
MARSVIICVAAGVTASACNVNAALEEVLEARHLADDLTVQFTKAADASNLAVMADTDEASSRFASEAKQRTAAAQKDADALRPLLETLKFTEEARLLAEFQSRFSAYQDVDRNILELAIENTNLKAQRLSFTVAEEAVEALRSALTGLEPSDDSREGWHVKALAASSVANATEIQSLQAPHIAETDDAVMTRIEQKMADADAAARRDLLALATLVRPASRPKLAAATAALDRLAEVNRQILGLSRRNTNVRSLALSLNQKRAVVADCEERLHALQAALSKRGYVRTR